MFLLAMTIRFVNLLLAALSVGAMFGVWLVFNPRGLDGAGYVTLQQQGIRTLNIVMPLMGAATIAATLAAAFLAREDRTLLTLLIATAFAFLLAGLITRFLNQPINAIVIRWSPSSRRRTGRRCAMSGGAGMSRACFAASPDCRC